VGAATLVFWIASIVALAGGLGVVLFKEPIRNVLSLVVVMLSLAVLFLLLSAQFVFVVQVIVYAGAVMVLFLFVITLLGPVREQGTVRLPWQVFISAVVIAGFAGFLVAMLRGVTYRTPDTTEPQSPLFGSVQAIGLGLFTDYLFPFELTSILLLVAAIGAIYLSRGPREGGQAGGRPSAGPPEEGSPPHIQRGDQ